MSTTIIITVVCLSVLGLVLAIVLYFVAQKFKVEEDPRIDEVESVLPGANCGGCGFAGCRSFAEGCVKADSLDEMFCPVGGNNTMKQVGAKLGFEVKAKTPKVAVIRCFGTLDNRPKTNIYDGASSCKIASSLYVGDTGCKYGCIGLGDCVDACMFDAIHVNEKTGLPEVIEGNCTACGACVKACPKAVIELRNVGPKSRRIYVSCVSHAKGGEAKKACAAACIGCGKCVKTCPFGAITLENSLAYIDFNKCKMCRKCVVECPTQAIWELNFPIKVPKPVEAPKPAATPATSATEDSKSKIAAN